MLDTEHRLSGSCNHRRKPEEAQHLPVRAPPLTPARPEGLAPSMPQGPTLLLRPFSPVENALRSQPKSTLPLWPISGVPFPGSPSSSAKPGPCHLSHPRALALALSRTCPGLSLHCCSRRSPVALTHRCLLRAGSPWSLRLAGACGPALLLAPPGKG